MARRDDILEHARELLDLDAYHDYGPMGMQVVGAEEVTRIAATVSSTLEAFRRAGEAGAQLLLVHHGMYWEGDPRVVDAHMKRRLQALFDEDITLAAYHLALDAHPELGNNVIVSRALGISDPQRFLEWGFGGSLSGPVTLDELAGRLQEATGREPQVFPGGPERIERVAVITGGAAKLVREAASAGFDAYVTGEPAEPTMHLARELGIHFLAGGHYATETFGIRALAERLADRFELEWEFLDVPVPV
ncbi:MAG TPA: Nif3-like dinuclear metal center hexameric protein [Gaiellaceae bacterium]|jgi:dinuclear metal center YbgI/SA1388 family protein|nr:Nif3-like dinuclear metal center hexameric protein [Gaiellaceae bacterium]